MPEQPCADRPGNRLRQGRAAYRPLRPIEGTAVPEEQYVERFEIERNGAPHAAALSDAVRITASRHEGGRLTQGHEVGQQFGDRLAVP